MNEPGDAARTPEAAEEPSKTTPDLGERFFWALPRNLWVESLVTSLVLSSSFALLDALSGERCQEREQGCRIIVGCRWQRHLR